MKHVFRAKQTAFSDFSPELMQHIGDACEILVCRKGKALIRFADGFMVVTSLNYLRRNTQA